MLSQLVFKTIYLSLLLGLNKKNMGTINLQNKSLRIMSATIIIAASIVLVISITEFGNVSVAYGQGSNNTSSSSSLPPLTPQQKAAMCNPNNPKLNFVNSTESKICGIPSTSTNTTTTPAANNNNTTLPSTGKQLGLLYNQGYTKGVADAKSVRITTSSTGTMMKPDDVDCDSSIDPQSSNEDYCSGYQHGYADTYNHQVNEGK
jgi:hypothetical protein